MKPYTCTDLKQCTRGYYHLLGVSHSVIDRQHPDKDIFIAQVCVYTLKENTEIFYQEDSELTLCLLKILDAFFFFYNDYEQVLDIVQPTAFFKPAVSSQIPLTLRISLTSSSAIRRYLCGIEGWCIRLGPLSNLLV